eukprot:CAMPEP_0184693212 /NCGR_PEP_ID=MMETSP0313-20130426/1488_1 /TAXON_ID=2792 /ORGANISM="Porphyridium aerugineum, Strain SAG 1380-2" /LENGTH=351 /DNA_ID=CAMNT_0027151225 /DNA_START=82 /DNA_END=1137 /DNA_ORIENTATION=+
METLAFVPITAAGSSFLAKSNAKNVIKSHAKAPCRARPASSIHHTHVMQATVADAKHKDLALSTPREASLPWTASIGGDGIEMLYMPFLVHQNHVMRTKLKDVKDLPFDAELALQIGNKKASKIESWCYQTAEFRKIRSTYIDCGKAAQVFNSVWYPDPKYDLPLLGVDFLSFGDKKLICILDLQPLSQDEAYLKKYIDPLAPIKAKYPALAGQMSSKFYDENLFFSKQLAFARSDDPTFIMKELFPAFKEYLDCYIHLLQSSHPETNPEKIAQNLQRQKDYDQYSAERDPAVGLFSTYFGPEWAEKFTHEFLFMFSTPIDPALRKNIKGGPGSAGGNPSATGSPGAAGTH